MATLQKMIAFSGMAAAQSSEADGWIPLSKEGDLVPRYKNQTLTAERTMLAPSLTILSREPVNDNTRN